MLCCIKIHLTTLRRGELGRLKGKSEHPVTSPGSAINGQRTYPNRYAAAQIDTEVFSTTTTVSSIFCLSYKSWWSFGTP